jgi:hypothetical protein
MNIIETVAGKTTEQAMFCMNIAFNSKTRVAIQMLHNN